METKYSIRQLRDMHKALNSTDYFLKEFVVEISRTQGAESVVGAIKHLREAGALIWDMLYPMLVEEAKRTNMDVQDVYKNAV